MNIDENPLKTKIKQQFIVKLPEVNYTTTKNGYQGVAIGSENLFLGVEKKSKWRFRFFDLHGGWNLLTAWMTTKNPEDLRTARSLKPIRDELNRIYPETWRRILEKIIGVIQDNNWRWEEEEEKNLNENKEDLNLLKMSPEEDTEVEEILNDPNPLERIKNLLDSFITGEDENKSIIFTLLLSGLIQNPTLKQIILLKAEAGAGKTTLMEIADVFNTKDVGRFTAHALDYTDLKLAS